MHVMNEFEPAVVFLQETKLYKKGSLKIANYLIFEKLREFNGGGGLMSIVHEDLKPVQVEEDDSCEDFLVVEITVENKNIVLANGYGPQETTEAVLRREFFLKLEMLIAKSKQNGKQVCIQIDANSKVGKDIIKGDPNSITDNGKLLLEVINRQNAVIVNATSKCDGVITRHRKTIHGEEKSVIDYFIVCRDLFNDVLRMKIHEDRKYVLSNFKLRNKNKCVVEADHNILEMLLNIKWQKTFKKERTEIFNLKNPENLKILHDYTSSHPKLVKCFDVKGDVVKQSRKWVKEIKNAIQTCFKKIRLTKKMSKSELDPLLKERGRLKEKFSNQEKVGLNVDEIKTKLKESDVQISEISARQNFERMKEHISSLRNNSDSLNPIKMWELKKKLLKNVGDPPSAKLNESKQLITEPDLLKDLYVSTYKHRLIKRIIEPGYEQLEDLKNGCRYTEQQLLRLAR